VLFIASASEDLDSHANYGGEGSGFSDDSDSVVQSGKLQLRSFVLLVDGLVFRNGAVRRICAQDVSCALCIEQTEDVMDHSKLSSELGSQHSWLIFIIAPS
jgi:hypothetical protein